MEGSIGDWKLLKKIEIKEREKNEAGLPKLRQRPRE